MKRIVTPAIGLRTLLLLATTMLLAVSVQAQTKRTHTVRAGDTLYRIAVNHSMSVEELQRLNGIEGTVIKVGQVLRLTPTGVRTPVTQESEDPAPSGGQPSTRDSVLVRVQVVDSVSTAPLVASDPPADRHPDFEAGRYQARPGETLYDVAFMLGISVDTLRALNPGHTTVLSEGEPLVVPSRFSSRSHTVRAGDTLSGIARREGLRVDALRTANPGVGTNLQIGQVLRLPSSALPAASVLPAPVAEGKASVYPEQFAGRLMAIGRPYDPTAHVLAHPTLPFGTVVMVEQAESGETTFAEVTDRMPVSGGYVVEVSRAVADAIGAEGKEVRVRVLEVVRE